MLIFLTVALIVLTVPWETSGFNVPWKGQNDCINSAQVQQFEINSLLKSTLGLFHSAQKQTERQGLYSFQVGNQVRSSDIQPNSMMLILLSVIHKMNGMHGIFWDCYQNCWLVKIHNWQNFDIIRILFEEFPCLQISALDIF